MPHPHLWPALIGTAVGFVLIVLASVWLARRWDVFKGRKRWLVFAALALFEAVYWLNVYAWLIEPNRLVVRRLEIESAAWHGAPITIAALGDTHVGGPHVDAARVGRVVQRVNALRPDLVVLLGDYVGGHASEQERSPRERGEILSGVAAFAALNAPLGVVGILGNHDSWYDRAVIAQAMEEAGVARLWNRHVVIARGDEEFVMAGLADEDTGDPSYVLAIDGAPAGADTVLIAHSPDSFADVPTGAALMLGSHGHCGQVTIPLVGRPILPLRNKRYGCHLIEEDGKLIYVTAGIGTSILPVRFLNPPEIALITLRATQP